MLIEHRLGSLDAAVNRLRRRNLGVSFGVLLVLVAAVAMMIVAAKRERHLARLEMQFAAAASHELRTPLTVIQALTHNIHAGIVKDPRHMQEYVRMIQEEATSDEIREALVDVLESEHYQEGARRMAGIVAGYERGDQAVRELESLLTGAGNKTEND